MIYDLKQWPNHYYSLWKEELSGHETIPGYDLLPSIKDYVDVERTSQYDLVRLKQYLSNGYICAVASANYVPSLFSGKPIYGELASMSDGKWFYESTLIHYIENDHLAIPDEWYNEIVNHNFTVPKISEEDLKILQSPQQIDLTELYSF